ncbi:PAS domain-containing protein [Nonlabens agnitus]|uniref:histidine kinase n=1 Tax=Nonlabens agnitus TaxID=870484 RepID=A0A2S9WU70_9FLAO|nr:PAS domain-containing protein [Nonlabens agnitus]PRP66876.1 hypothetical protein BST86_07075 [Nonlabens agnitus]
MVNDLKQSTFPYEELMTSTCLICMVVSNDSELIQANEEFFNVLGYHESYFDDHTILDITGSNDNWPDLKVKDGSKRERLSTTVKFYNDSGVPVYLKCNFGFREDRVYIAGVDVSMDIYLQQHNTTISHVANLGTWTYIPAQDKFHYNGFFKELFDLTDEQVLDTKVMYDAVHEDSLPIIDEALEKLYFNHEPYDVEIKLVLGKDEKEVWLRIIAAPEIYKGEVTIIQGVTQNITPYKELNIALEETKKNQELALRAINSGYFSFNLVTEEKRYSDSFMARSNFPEDMTREKFFKLVHPEDRDAALAQHKREIKEEGEFYFNAFRVGNEQGIYRHYEIHGFKVFNSDGEPIKLVANLIDVEDKYKLSEMEDKHRYHLRTMLDNTFVRSILLDKDSRIIGLDAKTKKILMDRLGYNPILKKSLFSEILSSFDLLKFNIIDRVLKKGQEYRNELYIDLFENSSTCYDALCKPILNYSQKVDGYVFYFFDLTNRVRLQEEVKSFQHKLITAHHFKNNVLAQITNNQRLPFDKLLAVTQGIFQEEVIYKTDNNLSEGQIRGGEELMGSLDEIINNKDSESLFFSSQKPVDLALLLQNMNTDSINKAKQEEIDFTFNNFEKLVLVNADPVFLRQSLANLLDLFFKICDREIVMIKSRINNDRAEVILYTVLTKQVYLIVEHVLNTHNASEESDTSSFKALGEGVPFAMKYLEGIKGKVEIQSNESSKAEFVLSLPLHH